MAYASLEDLVERAGQSEILEIADRDGDGIADTDVVDAALTHADNIVNGYVGAKYALPLSTATDLVRPWAVSIARYWLHRYGPPDYVVRDYKDAIATLRDVQAGKHVLQDVVGIAPEASQTSGSFVASHPPPHFDLRGWRE